ncbi:MAG: glutamine-hydrolyzing carbamoyl-phosphate synthase small subunit [Burkholderiales bacterium]|nr:glutamine-hydrolyzing carbamoyl-phosphate synthase small subunit [Burkholderiales bacterium]
MEHPHPATTRPALFAPVVPAVLALADGTVFRGRAIGAGGVATGEVVFNTAMTGYQEIVTDPSYTGQIVTLTYPHIGNVGVNAEDVESDRIHAAGLVIRDLPRRASNWRMNGDLAAYLRAANVVGIADLDTRRLTRLLREKGAQNGCIVAGAGFDAAAADAAVEQARAVPSMTGLDLAQVVTCDAPYEWTGSAWALGEGYRVLTEPRFHVVAYDFGVKHNILRRLAERGCRITVVPARMSAHDVLAMRPDGVFLSNGPGDPEPCDYAITAIRALLHANVPIFGICLGHQLLGLAAGGRTLKMKFGHHGANHPVLDRDTGQVLITSQNHGFAVDPASLPDNIRVTHVSLFDDTLQGFAWRDKPVFCFQGHPEASPGPHDVVYLFDRFVKSMEQRKVSSQ